MGNYLGGSVAQSQCKEEPIVFKMRRHSSQTLVAKLLNGLETPCVPQKLFICLIDLPRVLRLSDGRQERDTPPALPRQKDW